MKKLFFLCAFLFMSMQIQAQMYIIYFDKFNVENTLQYNIVTIAPDGTTETEEWGEYFASNIYDSDPDIVSFFQKLQEHVGPLLEEGYRFIDPFTNTTNDMQITSQGEFVFYLAVPWTTVGLTEIDSSELDFRISPNPAKEYINVEVNFKNQPSELVLISEQGYIYLHKDISNILSRQKFTVDISNIPAGKYLVTVKDSKQYLTPKKLIVF